MLSRAWSIQHQKQPDSETTIGLVKPRYSNVARIPCFQGWTTLECLAMKKSEPTLPQCECKEPEHTFTTYDSSFGEHKVRDDFQVAFCKSPCRSSGEEFSNDVYVWGKPRGNENKLNRRPIIRVRVFGRSKDEAHAAAIAILNVLEDRFANS